VRKDKLTRLPGGLTLQSREDHNGLTWMYFPHQRRQNHCTMRGIVTALFSWLPRKIHSIKLLPFEDERL
jgi:hypothetical protein